MNAIHGRRFAIVDFSNLLRAPIFIHQQRPHGIRFASYPFVKLLYSDDSSIRFPNFRSESKASTLSFECPRSNGKIGIKRGSKRSETKIHQLCIQTRRRRRTRASEEDVFRLQ